MALLWTKKKARIENFGSGGGYSGFTNFALK